MLILPLILPVTGGGSLILSDAKPPFVYFGSRTLSDRPFAVLPSPPAPAHCLTVVPSTSPPQPCPTLAEASLSLLFFTSRLFPRVSLFTVSIFFLALPCTCHHLCISSFYFIFKYVFVYLAVPGLSCSIQDLWSSLQHARPFSFWRVRRSVAACRV